MPTARGRQIMPDMTPYYHCTTRCVRRAFLCGEDRETGRSFDHRKRWIEARILMLGDVFAIDVAAYAVMSNHYHVVLHLNEDLKKDWSDAEVVERWGRVFKVPPWVEAYLEDPVLAGAHRELARPWIEERRERLSSVSWFMRLINEPLARLSNREDGCSGRFWESRFHSQALLDDKALVTCMAYVDLNPIRAGLAQTPETSPHTSVRARLNGENGLMAFAADTGPETTPCLPITERSYLSLVDWSGRALRTDKRGAIPSGLPPILARLDAPTVWLSTMKHYGTWYSGFVGSAAKLEAVCQRLGQRWLRAKPNATSPA